jgi:hypothetical protein
MGLAMQATLWKNPRRLPKGAIDAVPKSAALTLADQDYLERGGDINIAKRMADHSNVKTTELYDRRGDEVSFSEIERVGI